MQAEDHAVEVCDSAKDWGDGEELPVAHFDSLDRPSSEGLGEKVRDVQMITCVVCDEDGFEADANIRDPDRHSSFSLSKL